MKLSALLMLVMATVTWATKPDVTMKTADAEFLTKQAKVLSLYKGLSVDTDFKGDHYHITPFPFSDHKYYKDGKGVDGFVKAYKRGFLDKGGVYTLYCHKNRHNTFALFDIFYFAKDFDTFYQIAEWARSEMNPMQFYYAFTTAVLHREDTRGVYVPPMFEVFPHYFVQDYFMRQAVDYNTINKRSDEPVHHEINKTSWEASWHSDMISGIYGTGARWNGDVIDTRITFMREDIGLGNAFEFWNMRFANWLSTEKYPEIKFSHRGEYIYSFFKSVLDRYNLNRISVALPPADIFDTDKPVPGYNSHISDYMGRGFLVRPHGLVPSKVNPDDSWEADITEKRLFKTMDAGIYLNDGVKVDKTDRKGFETFARMIFGTRDTFNKKYYKPLYYNLLAAAKDLVKSPNDRDYTSSPLDLPATQTRDPVFYMILANLDYWLNTYLSSLPSYSDEQLNFSGVTFENFEVSKLVTRSVRRSFELTNGLPFEFAEDRFKYRSFADLYAVDHESFEYEMTVSSDKAQDAMIRIMIGPKTDADGRVLSLQQMRRAFVTLNKFIVKLNPGKNVFKKDSFQPEFYTKIQHYYETYDKVNRSLESNEPFEYYESTYCGLPYSMQIPRGTRDGKTFVMFAMVTPYFPDKIDKGYYQCNHNIYMDQYPIGFPFDRKIRYPNRFFHNNMIMKDVSIYHKFETKK